MRRSLSACREKQLNIRLDNELTGVKNNWHMPKLKSIVTTRTTDHFKPKPYLVMLAEITPDI